MNYVRVMPMAGNASAFLDRGVPYGFRATLVGERAEPGKYSALLGEHGIRAEVTATAGAALHRYTFPAAAIVASGGGTVAVDLTAAGLIMEGHTQPFSGVNLTISRTATTTTTMARSGGGGADSDATWVISGSLLTPPPAGITPGPDAAGLTMFVHIELGAGLSPAGVWPPGVTPAPNCSALPLSMSNTSGNTRRYCAYIELNAQQIATLGGSVGVAVSVDPTRPVAELAVGFSLRSVADAEASVREATAVGFDAVADAAWREWDTTLGRINVRR